MPFRHVSKEIKESIAFLLLSQPDMTISEIATQATVSKSTVDRVQSNLFHYRALFAPALTEVKQGRPSKISEEVEAWIIEYLNGRPESLLQEVVVEVEAQFGVELTRYDIGYLLRRLKWSKKVAVRVAAERNEELRLAWRGRIARFEPHQVVCLDESGSNERSGWRRYGWAPRGFKASYLGSAQRGERWSILPALSYKGYLAKPLLIQGAITREVLLEWLATDVLPLCNPYDDNIPRENSVLVLDNASIHRSQAVKDLCAEWGVRIEYLPPYSPDFNPIELTFNTLKTWIKQNFDYSAEFDDWGHFLDHAVSASGSDAAAAEYFTRAGIVYSSVDEVV